jgi:hypothetical protein
MPELLVKLMKLFCLVVLALAVGGCASMGGGKSGPGKVYVGDISRLPQITLPGAKLEQARSVAMAAARTKGWDIVSADANRVLLERPLPPGLPQAQALPSPLAAPRMQVATNLVERGDGTTVALSAAVLTNPGTPDEQVIDYTADFENELLASLGSLSSAWLAAQSKLNSRAPVLAEREAAEAGSAAASGEAAAETSADVAAAAAAPATAAPAPAAPAARAPAQPAPVPTPVAQAPAAPAPQAAPTVRASPAPAPAAPPAPQQAQVAPRPAPSPAPDIAVSEPATAGIGAVAPTIAPPASPRTAAEAASPSALRPGPSLGSVASPAPIAPTAPVEIGGSNEMLVLNQGSRKGLWSYYAEDYARLRGCKLGDRGAVLLQDTDGYELHEVQCVGSSNVRVRCRGGVCEPLR